MIASSPSSTNSLFSAHSFSSSEDERDDVDPSSGSSALCSALSTAQETSPSSTSRQRPKPVSGPVFKEASNLITSIEPPQISGLTFIPSILSPPLCSDLVKCMAASDVFLGGSRDQVMLFGGRLECRPNSLPVPSSASTLNDVDKDLATEENLELEQRTRFRGLPSWLDQALESIENELRGVLEDEIWEESFNRKDLKRQVILNLYKPGQGITPHVDLPNRYDSPIVAVSLLSGISFLLRRRHRRISSSLSSSSLGAAPVLEEKEEEEEWETHRFWLPERSVLILDGESRWEWEHGIESHEMDLVESSDGTGPSWRVRGVRVSMTFRWLKSGGDVVGG